MCDRPRGRKRTDAAKMNQLDDCHLFPAAHRRWLDKLHSASGLGVKFSTSSTDDSVCGATTRMRT